MRTKFGCWTWAIAAGVLVGIVAALGSAYFVPVLPGQGTEAAVTLISIAFVAGTAAAIGARLAMALACRMRGGC
ncbi:MAG: hypothetical protein ABSC72_11640 [Methylovirgula sp.]